MSVTRRGLFAVVALPALLFLGPGRAEQNNDPVRIGLILR